MLRASAAFPITIIVLSKLGQRVAVADAFSCTLLLDLESEIFVVVVTGEESYQYKIRVCCGSDW